MRYSNQLETIDPLEEGVRRELLSEKFTVLVGYISIPWFIDKLALFYISRSVIGYVTGLKPIWRWFSGVFLNKLHSSQQ